MEWYGVDVDINAPCPCGREQTLRRCCWRGGRMRPDDGMPPTRFARTGRTVDGCYASSLRDCDGALSGEHLISQSVLRTVSAGGSVIVTGFPHIKNGRKLGIGAAKVRVLCTRHNRDLSPVDAIAARLARSFYDIPLIPAGERRQRLFWGPAIERWMLKTLCARLASAPESMRDQVDCSIPTDWVRGAFGLRTPHLLVSGLHIDHEVGDEREPVTREGLTLYLLLSGERPVGLYWQYLEWSLAFYALNVGPVRPNSFSFQNAMGGTTEMLFAWPRLNG